MQMQRQRKKTGKHDVDLKTLEEMKKADEAELLREDSNYPDKEDEEDDLAEFKKLQVKRSTKIPPLILRFTGYHGTKVPVLMLKCLDSSEARHLNWCDKFWNRIVRHPSISRTLFCRDFYPADQAKRNPCVWQNLHGRNVGVEKCLFHMAEVAPAQFARECKVITAIPGRSKEELLEGYAMWREARRVVGIETRVLDTSEDGGRTDEPEIPDWMENAVKMDRRLLRQKTTPTPEGMAKERTWSMTVQLNYGLSSNILGHPPSPLHLVAQLARAAKRPV
eukprot:CAMPEP_0197629972 /NCGR_PEP_ID=MMETSP1338-20131121/7610_1 /TAXON_ID=43686 ORGANISM="Pelagodinium beii, Strain RCC1491" /NCGR_SAMPLE_ID=MMETSP1338 /ASSEMBLY_ACC=CAM_ASM_000754 /LENGTH=277 /DNA_ID=CAMNT_0043201089 /DNA_START=68 /DNA_END=902 /DNA_ORIENTATION=-